MERFAEMGHPAVTPDLTGSTDVAIPRVSIDQIVDQYGLPNRYMWLLKSLSTPEKLQNFMKASLRYHSSDTKKSFVGIVEDRKAHCFEQALGFAFPVLYLWGYNPRLVYINADEGTGSEEHAVTVYRIASGYGSVGHDGLTNYGYRPATFKTFDHLMASFYEKYTLGRAGQTIYCMRGYTDPIDPVSQANGTDWFFRTGNDALSFFWYHCTDNSMCTEVMTGRRYSYPAFFE